MILHRRRWRSAAAVACFLLIAAAIPRYAYCQEKTSVWKVSSETGIVYLIGSIHMLTERDAFPPMMDTVFREAEVAVFEIDPDSLGAPSMQKILLKHATLSEGRTLKSELGDSLYAITADKARDLGLNLDLVSEYRPWFIAAMLEIAEMQRMGFDPTHGVEARFGERAKETGKDIAALEKVEYQIELFSGFSRDEEREYLLQSLGELSDIEEELPRMVASWRTGSLTEIDAMLNKSLYARPAIYEKLIVQRNRGWIEKIEHFLESGKTHAVIVGVGHMPGKVGLIELLAQKGYTIEQMYAQDPDAQPASIESRGVPIANPSLETAKTTLIDSFKVGGTPIAIPPPTKKMVEVGDDNREQMESTVISSNRLIAAFVMADDLPRMKERFPSMHAQVQVLRWGEYMDCSASDFKEVINVAREQTGVVVDSSVKVAEEEINHQIESFDLELNLGKPIPVGCFFSKEDSYGLGMILPVSMGEETTKVGMGYALVRVRQRVLFIYVYDEYRGEDTIIWLRKQTEEWADAIIEANDGSLERPENDDG